MAPFLPKRPIRPERPNPTNLSNGPAFEDYNKKLFLNGNGNGNGHPNPYYEVGNDTTYYEANLVPEPKPPTYMEMNKPALNGP